ncbi:MAG TPA: hypothetical protein VLM38_20205, partial [Blastocatellia bacterium]|nr:hypothetical protein [Blastocatellia bacterium]
MNKLAINNLLVTCCSSFRRSADLAEISHGRFYQSLGLLLAQDVYSRHGRQNLGELLVELAEHVHALREMDELEQVGEILVNSPLPQRFKTIGRYYQAVCIQNFGEGDTEHARGLLEHVIESGTPVYRARAMISLAASLRHQHDNQSALWLYREAAHFASLVRIYDAYATLGTQKMVAVIGSENGDHRGAVDLLEQLYPVAQSVRSS